MPVYAEVQGTTLIQFPYTLGSLMAENPYTNYPSDIDIAAVFPETTTAIDNGYTLADVLYLPTPSYDPGTQVAVQDGQPTLIDGVWTLGWTVRPMTPEETAARKQQIKAQASQLLYETDWVDIPSVSDPANNPHLTNRDEFNTYRLALRQIAVYMPVDPVWPVKPAEQWST